MRTVTVGLIALGATALVASAARTTEKAGRPTSFASQKGGRTDVARVSSSAAELVAEPGCNATAFAQLPGDRSLFVGRQLVTAGGQLAGVGGPNDCSGGDPANERQGKPFNRWSLVLDRLDWKTRRFSIVKALLDTSVDRRTGQSQAAVEGGRMKGLRIRSAYDPSVATLNGTIYIAFECTVENGESFGVQQTSSCLSVYDPKAQRLNMKRTVVAVSGDRRGSTYYAAAVPRLMAFKGSLYLYWSALRITNGAIHHASVRGVRVIASAGDMRIGRANARVMTPFDPASTEVWTPTSSDMSNLLVNLMGFQVRPDGFLAFAALGGEGCTAPSGQGKGCFRLAVKHGRIPLAPAAFNKAEDVDLGLPTNPQEYASPVIDPAGRTWLMGHFVRPARNGYSERAPAPSDHFWRSSRRQSALVIIPMD